MPISERAKIFAPFSALKGLSEALSDKEKVRVPKKELSEDMTFELDKMLKSIEIGEIITVVYYCEKELNYIQITGQLIKIDVINRELILNSKTISFDNLFEIYR